MKVHTVKFKDIDGVAGSIDVTGVDADEVLAYYQATFPEGLRLTAITPTTKKVKRKEAGADEVENIRVAELAKKAKR